MTINTGGAAMIDYLCEITEPVYEYTRKPLRKDKRRLPEHMLKKRLSWVRGSMMTLIHTMKCNNGFYGKRGASCRVKHCDDIKRAIEHMPFCTMDRWCITQYCIATKTIVHHWREGSIELIQNFRIYRRITELKRNNLMASATPIQKIIRAHKSPASIRKTSRSKCKS